MASDTQPPAGFGKREKRAWKEGRRMRWFDGVMWRRVEARAGDTGVCPQCGEHVTLVKRGLVGDHAGGWCTWRGVPVESTRNRHG